MWSALAVIWCVFMVVVALGAVVLTVWMRTVEGRLDRLEGKVPTFATGGLVNKHDLATSHEEESHNCTPACVHYPHRNCHH